MTSSLKTRLVLAFLSTIIVPILAGVLTMYLGASNPDEEEEQLDRLFIEVREEIRAHEENLPDGDVFYEDIEPLLNHYDMNITIRDQDGQLLFDSVNYRQRSEENSFLPGFNTFTIQTDSETGAPWEVTIDAGSSEREPFQQMTNVLHVLFLSIGIGLLTLLLMIIIWTTYISRTILTPLKQIYKATEEMRDGNLDYPIRYRRKDEIGRFIQGFDYMRQHLKESSVKQQQYEESRKELIASISHDLRTPLSSIKGYVEGLRDGIVRDEEKKRHYLQVIHDKTTHLDHLIEDLFEFSKMEVDQLPMDKEVVNASDYFKDLLHNYQAELIDQHVQVTYTENIDSVSILIDPLRLSQVMNNLLENAVRYGSDRIWIDVHSDQNRRELVVRIADNGQGIEEEDLSYIFTSFYRAEKSRTTEKGGSGLGLSIVKYIVKAHGGDIQVDSEEEKGSTFVFTIPLYVTGNAPEEDA
ncbi:HAMP domain-containing protein [Salimicrobium halophilum]|uniref:histidine kinase n=2 Tax=Salimicrobium halophilum TaxID=86666 RepID=A0A1G8V7A9_9BACI|nr:HAMP domain-containing protein [Salimicrobium halophilum]